MEANKFITNENENMLTQMNTKRVMTDDELKVIFGEGHDPNHVDFECLIDSKANVQDVYTKKFLQEAMEAYYGSSPEIAKDWYDKEMERRSSEDTRKSNEVIRQSQEQTRQTSVQQMNTNINNKIVEVEGRMGAIESEFDSLVEGTGFATMSYVDNTVAGIVNSAPETLDTLNELANALGNDPNFATTITTQIGSKTDREEFLNHRHRVDDVDGLDSNAISYNNNESGIAATNVQSALDEIDSKSKSNKDDIFRINSELSKSDNTKYSTVNGVKEFTCKDGYVDNIVIEGCTKILDANNVECEPGAEGAKLVSVGQGDKIEVLSLNSDSYKIKTLQFKNWNGVVGESFDNCFGGAINHTRMLAEVIALSDKYNYVDFVIPTGYTLAVAWFDSNQRFIVDNGWITSNTTPLRIVNNAKYISYYLKRNDNGIMNQSDIDFCLKNSYVVYKYDKKQILTTLRSLPNGVKDEIIKQGDKYYKIQRCGEFVLNGASIIGATIDSSSDVLMMSITVSGLSNCMNDYQYGHCDKLKYERLWDSTHERTYLEKDKVAVMILKSKLTSYDLEGVKSYFNSNNYTYCYKTSIDTVTELPNFNPQTYADKTTLLINSGVVQAECDFEVTNSLGSEIDVLKGKTSDLDRSIIEVNNKAELAFQRGDNVKQMLVDKLISGGMDVSTSDSFEDLIGNMNLGKKWASGTSLSSSSTKVFNYMGSTNTSSSSSYITIPKPNFKVSSIMFVGDSTGSSSFGFYTTELKQYYTNYTPYVLLCYKYSSTSLSNGMPINIKANEIVVTANTFEIPVVGSNSNFNWIAYE